MKIKLSGINAEVEIGHDSLIIKKGWFLSRALRRDKLEGIKIRLEDIKDISLTKGTHLTNGKLIIYIGNTEEKIIFKKISNEIASDLYKRIKCVLNNKANKKSKVKNINNIEEIREYKKLYDEGIISEEEFNIKKKELLGI